MKKNILINDRIYKNIESFCFLNKMKISDYIENALSDKINTDMYGDLNKIKNNEFLIELDKKKLDFEKKILFLWFKGISYKNNKPLQINLNDFEEFKDNIKKSIIKTSKNKITTDIIDNNLSVDDNLSIDNNKQTIKRKLKIK